MNGDAWIYELTALNASFCAYHLPQAEAQAHSTQF
jgi:hypothetical protein